MSERSAGSRFLGILVALAVAGGAIYYKFSQKGDYSSDVKANTMAMFAELPDVDLAYMQELVDRVHEDAFHKCFALGGRRQQSSFDEGCYYGELLPRMAFQAKRDGKPRVSVMLETLSVEAQP